jgi:autotransporter passenger strand-loop-strand repeat protein
VLDSGGDLIVLPGASAVGTVLSGGLQIDSGVLLTASSGGTYFPNSASGVAVREDDELYVLSAGTATGADVTVFGLAVVLSGGVASATTVSSAGEEFVSGGVTYGTVVGSGGIEFVFSGGVASGTVVSSGGQEIVSRGGVASGTLVSNGGYQTVESGGVASGTVVSSGGQAFVSGGVAYGTVVGSGGQEIVSKGGVATGTVVGSGGQGVVSGGGSAISTTIGTSATLQVRDGGTVSFVLFDGGGGLLLLDGTTMPSAPISGFSATDVIDLAGLLYSSGGSATLAGNTLTITEGSQSETLTLASPATSTFVLEEDAFGGTEVITCFLAGTRIATLLGETPVENLQVGDLVALADGRAAPVRWLGVQTVSTRFANPARVLPIRIGAGALGANMPARDLLVSPGHAILLDRLLVQAGALVGLPGIVREHAVPLTFRYYHVQLDEHALLLAEGVAAESYLEVVEEVAFDNRAERPAGALPAELKYARVKSARQLPKALRTRLAGRAAA